MKSVSKRKLKKTGAMVITLEGQKRILSTYPLVDLEEKARGKLGFSSMSSRVIVTADLLLDIDNECLYRGGRIVNVGKTEFDLIRCLVTCMPSFCSRSILKEVAEDRLNHSLVDNTLSKHIHRIRTKLGTIQGRSYIETKNSYGYRWVPTIERYYLSPEWYRPEDEEELPRFEFAVRNSEKD